MGKVLPFRHPSRRPCTVNGVVVPFDVEAIVRRDIEMTHEEVAAKLGMTVDEVKRIEARALRKLRPLLRSVWWSVVNE